MRPGGGGGCGGGGVCFSCGKPGHQKRDCPGGGGAFGGGDVAGALRQRMGAGQDEGEWGKDGGRGSPRLPPVEVEPEYGLSGALARETNTTQSGVALVYSEPPEARPPPSRAAPWRLYCFKGTAEASPPLPLTGRSSWLVGRERKVADIGMDHPSVSSQHAVLQWRLGKPSGDDAGSMAPTAPLPRLYVMDLGSTNGTFLGGRRLEAQVFVELFHQDSPTFGSSTREFVLIDTGAKSK